ncbi:hypothetical protein ACFO3J_01660 [Streptomyces polygonati]|uniref:Secreted protein n=1 Tax=Streptomyces polygonati TaxID=1617087 RepID=A0ABV8HH48_9ACTN
MTDETPPAQPSDVAHVPPDLPDVPPDDPPEVPGTGSRPKRGLALGITGALVAIAAGGGIGYAVLEHDGSRGGAAAAAAARPWIAPTPSATKAFGAKSGGSHFGSLDLLLLPVDQNHKPGPDVAGYGNDAVLDAQQAQALAKGDLSWMSKKDRKKVDAAIDALHIEGEGLRTYRSWNGDLVVQMALVQMKNKEAARAEPEFFREFTKAMGIFRVGPKVQGYPQAVCVLPPAEPGDQLDSMTCEATEGDLKVTMTVHGARPLDKTSAVDLLRQQLSRIKDPGQAV